MKKINIASQTQLRFMPVTQPELSKDIISMKSLTIIGIILKLLYFKCIQEKKFALDQDDFAQDNITVSMMLTRLFLHI